jgi:hypothetical protein
MPMQVCTKCKRELPADIYHFHRNKNKQFGYNDVCKECRGYKLGEVLRNTEGGCCGVAECCKPALKDGLCDAHYQKKRKYGDPLGAMNKYVPQERNCGFCGTPFTPTKEQRTRPKRYCSKKCGTNATKDKRAIAAALHKERNVVCEHCGKVFRRTHVKILNKYCSNDCWLAAIHPTTRSCVVCGKEFTPRSNRETNVCCSRECYRISACSKCKMCGKEFMGAPSQVYCSRDCQHKDHWETKGRLMNRSYVHARKALRRKTYVAKVEPKKIFERDNWICQLCGRKVNPKLKHPHLMSPTIDHIIPLSRGGTHEPKNVQLAHFTCNCQKNNGLYKDIPEQLLLFG